MSAGQEARSMRSEWIETDAVIVGAGPCGLFQVFELGLQGIRAHVIDSMRVVGGQCAELYPDKPIYDIPGIPVLLAQELVDNLMEQIAPFEAEFHLGQEVTVVKPVDDQFEVETSAGTRFLAKTVFLAGGVGTILYSNSDEDNLFSDNHATPAVHIDNTPGLAIKAYITDTVAPVAEIVTGEPGVWPWAPSMTIF